MATPRIKPLLSIQDLKIDFEVHGTTINAVQGVSFDIYPGTSVALVGESGSGKSVIARSIMGLLASNGRASGGRIMLNRDHDQTKNGQSEIDILAQDDDSKVMQSIRGGTISMIFQEPMVSLSPLHTIGDQVSEALLIHRDVSKAEGEKLTLDMLQLVGFRDARQMMSAYSFELSGGMRQRAMIAMALVCRPALLIADEPTTALDVTIQAQILELIAGLQKQLNMAVLMITHDLGVVANVAEQVVVLYQGRVMERGTVEQIYRNPGHRYTRALMDAVPRFDMGPEERLTPIREIKPKIGSMFQQKAADVHGNPDILTVENVSKSFTLRSSNWSFRARTRIVKAVDDVSFTLRRGECLGLVGESGCGKTTLAKMVARAHRPDQGKIHFYSGDRSYDVESLEDQDLKDYRRRAQYIFQDPVGSLNPRMTIYDTIREPLAIHQIGDRDRQIEIVKELMELVGLDTRFLRRYPHSFSGGQRQRIGIARALALQPEMLICDEPVSALDVSIQAQILNLLRDLRTKLNLSYLFISHNLAVIDYIADRVAVMLEGRLIEIADRHTLFTQPAHPYTQSLLSAVPFADLDHPLDFKTLQLNQDASAWELAFREQAGAQMQLREIAPDHWVRMHQPQEAYA
jgi:peptide/nickel transport system ATP-binding protein